MDVSLGPLAFLHCKLPTCSPKPYPIPRLPRVLQVLIRNYGIYRNFTKSRLWYVGVNPYKAQTSFLRSSHRIFHSAVLRSWEGQQTTSALRVGMRVSELKAMLVVVPVPGEGLPTMRGRESIQVREPCDGVWSAHPFF